MTETCLKCLGKGIVYEKDGSSHTCFDCLNSGKLTSFHHNFEKEEERKITVCPKCFGSGIVKEKNGMSHTCWDCLSSGRLDNHSKDLKDSGIKI